MSRVYAFAKSWDVVAFTYRAEILCPRHTSDALGDAMAARYEWGGARRQPYEGPAEHLERVARFLGIHPPDERQYASDEYPKVVVRDQIADVEDACGPCGALEEPDE